MADEQASYSVLPKHLSGGPHGLGDPNDKSLRKLERDVVIPKKMRELIKTDKCAKEVKDFSKCCGKSELFMVMKCRKENAVMRECYERWFFNEDFRKECTERYLEDRSEYRRTGISAKERKRRQREETLKTFREQQQHQQINQM